MITILSTRRYMNMGDSTVRVVYHVRVIWQSGLDEPQELVRLVASVT